MAAGEKVWAGFLDLEAERLVALSGPATPDHVVARVLIKVHDAPVGWVDLPLRPTETLASRAKKVAERELHDTLRQSSVRELADIMTGRDIVPGWRGGGVTAPVPPSGTLDAVVEARPARHAGVRRGILRSIRPAWATRRNELPARLSEVGSRPMATVLSQSRTEVLPEPHAEMSPEPQTEELPEPAGQVLRRELVTVGFSLAFAMSLCLLGIGYGVGSGALRLTGILGTLFLGVGTAPTQFGQRSSLITRLGLAGVVGLAMMTTGPSLMSLFAGWHPERAAIVVAGVSAAAHVVGCVRAVRTLSGSGVVRSVSAGWRLTASYTLICTVSGTALWAVAAARLGHVAAPGIAGFLPRISPLWFLGLLLLLTALVLAQGKPEVNAMLPLLSLMSSLTLTPALVYGMPRSQSAAKHVDLVQQVMNGYYLDRHAGIYQVYSGLFSGAAWVCRLAHVPDSMVLATFWPFIIGIVAFVELRFLFGSLFPPGYRVWIAMTLAVLVNALGADYFSPQSVGFVLALGIYAIAVGQSKLGLPEPQRILLLVWLGCSLAITHELTPYIVSGVLAVLAAFRVIRPWYTPAAILLPALLWMGLNWHAVKGYISFAGVLDLANFAPPKTVAQSGLARLPIVSESSRALLVGLVVLTAVAVAGFVRTRRDKASWAFFISAGIGLMLIAGNSYGNEGIFRAALFGIPWLAILAIQAIPQKLPSWAPGTYGLLSAGLVGTFLVANFGLDNAGVIRYSDMQAMKIYQERAAPDSDLMNLSYGDIPTDVLFPQNGHEFGWQNVATPTQLGVRKPDEADAAALANEYIAHAESLGVAPVGELYALWSPAAAAYAVDYGLETQAQADEWRHVLATSKSWHVVFREAGTYLYVVNG